MYDIYIYVYIYTLCIDIYICGMYIPMRVVWGEKNYIIITFYKLI